MFGTVARLRIKPGAMPLLRAWGEALRPDNVPGSPRMRGWVSTTVYQTQRDPAEAWLAVVFEDEASYRANAALPGQHEWYLRMRALLEEDPEWIDGDVAFHTSSGESSHPTA